MDCRETREDFFEYLKGWLSAEHSEGVSAHIKSCSECSKELEAFRETLGLAASAEEISPGKEFPGRILQYARERTRLEAEVAAPSRALKVPVLGGVLEGLHFIVSYIRFRASISLNFRAFAIANAVIINLLLISFIAAAIFTNMDLKRGSFQVRLETLDEDVDGDSFALEWDKLISKLTEEAKTATPDLAPSLEGQLWDPWNPDDELHGPLALGNSYNALRLRWLNRSDIRKRSLRLEKYGGSEKTEKAVSEALEWLAQKQNNEGFWEPAEHKGEGGYKIGSTSLALLAFLGRGSSSQYGSYLKTVRRGIEYLVREQQASGYFGTFEDNVPYRMEQQALGLLAIIEDCIPGGFTTKRTPVLEMGLEALLKDVNISLEGGERISGWVFLCLRKAANEGVLINQEPLWKECLKKARKGIDYERLMKKEPPEVNEPTGFFMALSLAGEPPPLGHVFEMKRRAEQYLPAVEEGLNFPSCFFITFAVLHYCDNSIWEKWNGKIQNFLLANQRPDGAFHFLSWRQGNLPAGIVQSTALGALILESSYRFDLTAR